jgi:cell division protein FtsB
LATLAVAAYFLFAAGNNALHSYRLATDETRLRQEVEALMSEKDQLLQIRDFLRTDEYIEFMARRVFGLVKPGESIVIVDAPPDPEAFEDEKQTWWQRLFGR